MERKYRETSDMYLEMFIGLTTQLYGLFYYNYLLMYQVYQIYFIQWTMSNITLA
jgi:hypothetical protein